MYSLSRGYQVPKEVTSQRPPGASEWHDVVLHVLLRRRAFLPSLSWPGAANTSTPYHAVWEPSGSLRRDLCAMVQPGEPIQEGWPASLSSYSFGPVPGREET